MNHKPTAKLLPAAALLLGILGMALRWALYTFCMDEKNLLPWNHPIEVLLWTVTGAALGLIAFSAWKLGGSNRYWDNFRASSLAAAGHGLFGLGVLLTALLNQPHLLNNLGRVWKLLGILSGPCLMAAGCSRYRGRRPHFLLHIAPCLFLVFHIINHYQLWSGNPQPQDYVFTLFGTMALMFFCFYTAAFEVGSGRRQMHLAMGLAAVYLCIVSIPGTEYLYLYVSGILWVLSDLCTLTPKPRVRRKKKTENRENPNEAA